MTADMTHDYLRATGSTKGPDLQSLLDPEERRERARALEQLLEYVRQAGRRYFLTQLTMRNP